MTTNSRSTNLTNDDVTVHYRYISADGVHVFYRKAGDPKAPTILLLHDFPSSSHMFRDLISKLSNRYRIVAPDLPGFGFTEVPQKCGYIYTFEGEGVIGKT